MHALRPKEYPWWVSFALLFALGALWSFASPLFSAPDEPAHVVKAAALMRGQVLPVEVASPRGPIPSLEVPEILARTMLSSCYGRADESARCVEPLEGSTRSVTALTYAGRYPPLYYLLIGWPSLFFPSATGVHLMRLMSAAISAAFLASAFASARAATKSSCLVVGLAVAVTPMVLFLAGSVNPSGLEIAAGIGLWVSLIALVLGGTRLPDARLSARVGLAGAVLSLSRPLSALWMVIIVILVVIMARRTRLNDLVHQPVIWIWAGVAGVGTLAAGVWIIVANALQIGSVGELASDVGPTQIARKSLGKSGDEVLQMIGTFGWLDTPSPLITYYVWLACIGFLVIAGLAVSGRREALVLTGLVLLILAVPRLVEASQASALGYVWQGRYTLPLAVGVPLVAALLVDHMWALSGKRLTRLLVGAMLVGHVLAFLWALRRNAVGVSGPLWPVDWPEAMTASALLATFTFISAMYGWWVTRLAAPGQVLLETRDPQ